MADGALTASAPAQGSLESTFFLPFRALLRQAPARRQRHFLYAQALCLPFVLGGEKSAVCSGHPRSFPKASFVVLDGGQPRVRVSRVPLQNLVAAHDPVFHFIDSHQPTKLVRLMRFSLADHLRMRLKQAQHFVRYARISSPQALSRLHHHLFHERQKMPQLAGPALRLSADFR